MAIQMQQRRDSAADWTSADPTLAEGEIGIETDTGKMKIGDGSTAWTSLDYTDNSISHDSLLDVSADDHHAESHNIASHDTTATGAELDTLTDGSDSDSLHTHPSINAEIDSDIATHAAIATAHQDAPALISTHAGDSDAHHTKYTDAEAEAVADTQIATHTADTDAHHAKYTDAEAVGAVSTDDAYLLNTGDTASGDYNFASGTFFIDSSAGKVGIGTTNPDKLLHLAGADTSIIRLENTDASLTNDQIVGGLEFERQDGSGPGAGVAGGLRMKTEGSVGEGGNYLTFSVSDSTTLDYEAMRIDSDGNVGIGTTEPGAKLDVVGKIMSSSADENFNAWIKSVYTTDEVMQIGVGEHTMISTGDNYYHGSNLNFHTADTIRMKIDHDGNVGIGTTEPDAKLEVNGDTFIGDGTNYTEIKSDGEINLHGTARVIKELDFNAASVKAPGVDGAEWVSHGIIGAWEFANNKEEEITAAINFPKDIDLSIAPTLRVCWSSNATSEDAVWQLEYLFRHVDEDTTANAQETLTQTATSSATADGLTHTDFTGIDIPDGSDKKMFIRLTRLSGDGSDTLGDTAELHSIIFKYTSDKLGETT